MFSFSNGFSFFGPKKATAPTPDELKEQIKKWRVSIRREQYGIKHQINALQRDLTKMEQDAKKLAKMNQERNVRTLCASIARGRNGIRRLETVISQLESLELNLQEQATMLKVAGALSASTQIMRSMRSLVNAPEIMGTMRTLEEEMNKAGVISEIVDEAMENTMPVDTEEVDEVVDQVLWEVTQGVMGKAPPASNTVTNNIATTTTTTTTSNPRVAVGLGGDDDTDQTSSLRNHLGKL